MLEKVATTKRFKYSLLGKELLGQNDTAKDQFDFFLDQINVKNSNREEDENDEDKSDESKIPKKFNVKNNRRTSKPISVKSLGSNISLNPLIIKLLTAEKKGLKNYLVFLMK